MSTSKKSLCACGPASLVHEAQEINALKSPPFFIDKFKLNFEF